MIISLGGGCDVATILDTYGLRTQSLPFDWLWNLDTGLADVTQIIATDFKDLRKKGSYVYAPHFHWPEKDSLVFRKYPNIAHIHTNPLKNTHERETYNRRITKFMQFLQDDQIKITFMYYRSHCVGENPYSTEFMLSRLKLLFIESNAFMEMICKKYPDRQLSLISLFDGPEELPLNVQANNLFNSLLAQWGRKDIHFHFIPTRPTTDGSERKLWIKKWLEILKKYNLISWLDLMLVRPRKIRKKLRRHYLKYRRKK